jgi:hypothetical protein
LWGEITKGKLGMYQALEESVRNINLALEKANKIIEEYWEKRNVTIKPS